MAPKDLPWFRFYSEARRDPKIRKAAKLAEVSFLEAFGFWAAILSLAGESPDRGKLLVTLQERFSIEDVAFECNTDETTAQKLLAAFVQYDMIDIPKDGPISIRNWDKRQFSSDNSTERVRKYREKQECNVPETPASVSVSVSGSDSVSDTTTPTNPKEPEPQKTPHQEFVNKLVTNYPELAFYGLDEAKELDALFDKHGETTLLDIASWMHKSTTGLRSMSQYLRFTTSKAPGWNSTPPPPVKKTPTAASLGYTRAGSQ